jgi:hypothetical protein
VGKKTVYTPASLRRASVRPVTSSALSSVLNLPVRTSTTIVSIGIMTRSESRLGESLDNHGLGGGSTMARDCRVLTVLLGSLNDVNGRGPVLDDTRPVDTT